MAAMVITACWSCTQISTAHTESIGSAVEIPMCFLSTDLRSFLVENCRTPRLWRRGLTQRLLWLELMRGAFPEGNRRVKKKCHQPDSPCEIRFVANAALRQISRSAAQTANRPAEHRTNPCVYIVGGGTAADRYHCRSFQLLF